MQGLLSILTLGLLLSGPPSNAPAESPAPELRYSRALDNYARLDTAGQAAWLTGVLEHRGMRASRLLLGPEELQATAARRQTILEGVRAGRRLSRSGLLSLLAEIDAQEVAAMARLEAEYQSRVERQFAQNPQARRAWQSAIAEMQAAWNAAGRTWEHQPQVLDWLQDALARLDKAAALAQGQRPAREPSTHPQVATTPPAAANPPLPTAHRQTFAPVAALPAGPAVRMDKQTLTETLPSAGASVDEEQGPSVRAAAGPARSSSDVAAPLAAGGTRVPLPKQHRAAKIAVDNVQLPPLPSPGANGDASPGEQINERELAVRITSYNVRISALVAQLGTADNWRPAQLNEAVDQLSELMAQRSDLLLYWNLLSDEARQAMKELESPRTAITLLASRTAELRKQLAHQRSDATEVQQLDLVSRRLAELAAAR